MLPLILISAIFLLEQSESAPSFLRNQESDFCISNDESWVVDTIYKHSVDILSRIKGNPRSKKEFFMKNLGIASDLSLSREEKRDKMRNTWAAQQRYFYENEGGVVSATPALFLTLVKTIKGYCVCQRLNLPDAAEAFYGLIFEEEFIRAGSELRRQWIQRVVRQYTKEMSGQ